MAASKHLDLASAVQHYDQVAYAVNRREIQRFTEVFRQTWVPEPAAEWDPRGEGYTDEGAFALHIYQLAFDVEPERHGEMCEAEEKNQVLLHPPLVDMVDEIPKPLADPAPLSVVDEKSDLLRAQLQFQVDQAATALTVHLPDDFRKLMLITNGINGAGVPSETAYTVLIWPVEQHHATAEMLEFITRGAARRGFEALAAWEIGCCVQFRQIYYVLGRPLQDDNNSNATWRILDRQDVELEMYSDLTQFLEHETLYVEGRPGGAQQVHIID